jgi:hypothetical protein
VAQSRYYFDMTPESRNSSFLGNDGKQIPAEMYTQAKREDFFLIASFSGPLH